MAEIVTESSVVKMARERILVHSWLSNFKKKNSSNINRIKSVWYVFTTL